MNDQIKHRQGGSLKVFIVEDSAIVCEILHAMLSRIFCVAVVGFADDEAGAIEGIETLLPDVVILDLHLQQGTGLNVLLHVKKHHAAVKVIVLSDCADALYLSICRQAGADYLFDKSLQFMLIEKVLAQMMSPNGSDGEIAGLKL